MREICENWQTGNKPIPKPMMTQLNDAYMPQPQPHDEKKLLFGQS